MTPDRKKKKAPGRKALAVDDRPEERTLTDRQAMRLARRTGMAAEEIGEMSVGQLHERLKGRISPELLGFQQVCGQVVQRDPETGELRPVPFATVHVEDTDCSFLFYAPSGFGYVWLYPGLCSREEITTVQTDECGRFCVWIPRWEVDHILRWRRERVCFPELEPPLLVDVLEDLFPIPGPRPPFPLPDPPPDFTRPELRRELESRLGPVASERLTRLAPDRSFGAFKGAFDAALREPAPPTALPRPPTPDPETLPVVHRKDERFGEIDLVAPLGPYRLCVDVFVPEWTVVFDVPDITFRVTQTQDGSEVTIYDEGYFDVRWNDTSIPDVTLEAGPNARAVDICGEDPGIACEDEPAILNISEMPLASGYHDDSTGDPTFGYGIRVNQPSSDGVTTPTPGPAVGPAHAPYADRLNFYGCFHIEGSDHYRVVAAFEGGAAEPITNVTFPVLTDAFTIDYQVPDADGWYPIRNDLLSSYEHLILPWPTQQSRFPDGTYELVLEVGSGSPGSVTTDAGSDPYTFQVDNARPTAAFHQIRWWHEGDGPGTAEVLDTICPVLHRDATRHVIVEVTWSASALHLRSASAAMSGCGAGNPSPLGALADRKWWWENPGDGSTGVKVARWRIPATLDAGCYTAALHAVSRAYNPAVPGASTSADWYVLENRRDTHPRRAISVVDT